MIKYKDSETTFLKHILMKMLFKRQYVPFEEIPKQDDEEETKNDHSMEMVITEILFSMKESYHVKGEVILEENAEMNCIIIVLEGEINITCTSYSEFLVDVLYPTCHFGYHKVLRGLETEIL
jgi:hypothetical protein